MEFPKIQPRGAEWTQSLRDYCEYYNGGKHRLGYDLTGKVDFGSGKRTDQQRTGRSVNGTPEAVHPGTKTFLSPSQIIAIVKSRIPEILEGNHSGNKTDKTVLVRSKTRKSTTTNKSHPGNNAKSGKAESRMGISAEAVEGMLKEVKRFMRVRNKSLRDLKLKQSNGICEACGIDFSNVLGGRGRSVLLVHHDRRHISNYRHDGQVTTERDLSVICANCHMLLHSNRKSAMKVGALRRMLRGFE